MHALLAVPFLGTLVLACIPSAHMRAVRVVGVLWCCVPLAVAIGLFVQDDTGVSYTVHAPWIAWTVGGTAVHIPWHVSLDGFSMPFVMLAAIVCAVSGVAGFLLTKRWKAFYVLLLLLTTAVFGVFVARDVVLFFLFFELTLVPMFFLIGMFGKYGRERAANVFLVYNGIGSAVLFLAVVLLIVHAGSFAVVGTPTMGNSFTSDYAVIASNLAAMPHDGMHTVLFWLFFLAFAIKLPVFPLHTWMLRVHGEAHPAIVIVHSGVLLKMGAFGMLMFSFVLFPEVLRGAASALAVGAVVTIVVGAVMACAQKDVRLVFAYASLSHMGFVLLGMVAMNDNGVQGALFQLVSHGLISALLFFAVAVIETRTQTSDIASLGGLGQPMPFASAMLMIGALAALGLPGLSGFVGEWLVLVGAYDQWRTLTVIATGSVVLSAVYMLRVVLGIVFGPPPQKHRADVRTIEAFPMVFVAACIVVLGVYPSVLHDVTREATKTIVAPYEQLVDVGGGV